MFSALGGSDWQAFPYYFGDGFSLYEVGTAFFSLDLGLLVRIGYFESV